MEEGAAYYVFKQTHEPLFRQEDGQNFTSSVLASWSRGIDYSEFRFCPAASLTFDGETGFTPDFLYSFLLRVSANFDPTASVGRSGDCTDVKFIGRRPGYLYYLSRMENAPAVIKGSVSFGLGAFRVRELSETAIELERKSPIKRGYNRIRLLLYAGAGDPRLSDRNISDFNRLSSFQQPDWIRTEYASFYNIDLRVVTLAINHPDAEMRRALYGCLDVREFRRAIVPGRSDFYDIQTVLPMGVPGARSGTSRQVCDVPARLREKRVVLANPRADNLSQISEYAKDFRRRTGIELVIKNYKPSEIDAVLMDRKKRSSYNLVVVVVAGFLPDQEEFFSFFASGDRVIDYVPEEMLVAYAALRAEGDPEKKKKIAEALADLLGKDGFVLPLYQTFTRLYYPPGIKNLTVGRGFTEIPDVAALRW
jgi:hypothetical protein